MKLSAPTQLVWVLSVILVILGVIGHFVSAGFLTTINIWLILAGYILLALGTLFKGV